MAEMGLINGMELPPTLFADMGGSLMASEAVLKAVLQQSRSGKGVYLEVALSGAAGYLGLPNSWGLTTPGKSLGGAHAGYRLYPCKDGRVAVAALEPHFAAALCQAAGVAGTGRQLMFAPSSHEAICRFLASRTCSELDALAKAMDIPLYTMAPSAIAP
jgi:alpha-methylacyl-CoA racemase